MQRTAMCVLLFETIHDVIAAEKIVQGQGFWCDLIPTPRELSSDCGMSLAVRTEDAGVVREQLIAAARACSGAYRRVDGGFESL